MFTYDKYGNELMYDNKRSTVLKTGKVKLRRGLPQSCRAAVNEWARKGIKKY